MIKKLKSSMRQKNRYILFEVKSDNVFDRKKVVDCIWSNVLRIWGEAGAADLSLWIMDWDMEKQKGIIKVNHKSADILRSSLFLIKDIAGMPAAFNTLQTSGTLKKVREGLSG